MKGASRHTRGVWPLWPCCTEASLPVIDCIDIEGALFRSDERLRAGKRHTVLTGEERLTGPEMVNQGKQRARALTATTGAQCKWITTKCSMRKLRSMTVAGVTRFLVDFYFREAAINFEDSGRRVNISLADFGMESGTTADPNSTRKAFKKELGCVPYFDAPPVPIAPSSSQPLALPQETTPCPRRRPSSHVGNVRYRLRCVDA